MQSYAPSCRHGEQPKWVVLCSLKSVGPNAAGLLKTTSRARSASWKAERDGEIEVAGPDLAQSLPPTWPDSMNIASTCTPSCLVKANHISPDLGPLRLMTTDRVGEDVIRLTYVSA